MVGITHSSQMVYWILLVLSSAAEINRKIEAIIKDYFSMVLVTK